MARRATTLPCGWDQWVKNHIAVALKAYHEANVDAVGEAMSVYVTERLAAEATKLREEIAGLRIDTAVNKSVLRGEINALLKKKVRA